MSTTKEQFIGKAKMLEKPGKPLKFLLADGSVTMRKLAQDVIEYILGQIAGGVHWRGITTTELSDGDTTNPIMIDGKPFTAENGDIVGYLADGQKPFDFIFNGEKWQKYGLTSVLGDMAFVNTASGTVLVPNALEIVQHGTSTLLGKWAMPVPAGKEYVKLSTETVGSASEWSAGTLPNLSVDESTETLTLSAGTLPSLIVTQKNVGTALTGNDYPFIKAVNAPGADLNILATEIDQSEQSAGVLGVMNTETSYRLTDVEKTVVVNPDRNHIIIPD